MIVPTLLGLATVLFIYIIILQGARKKPECRLSRLPPGPPTLPFFGNLFNLDRNAPFLSYTLWSKKYGDIISIRILNQHIVILNSEEVANALFEKRSQKYSDRPVFLAANLFGWQWGTSLARYGPRFRLHRRLLHQSFNAQTAMAHRPRQAQKAYDLVTYLLDDPTGYATHFTTFSTSTVMEVAYGYDVTKGSETFVTVMQRAADILLHNATVEIFALCAAFPFVMSLPAWLPGMGFKTHAAECRRLAFEALNGPYEWVKQRMADGSAAPSMISDAIARHRLDDESKNPELVLALKESAATLYAAAVETTNATLLTFIYLMMNHPEVQHRAHAELDSVVGQQRLPDFDDRPSLPYVDAIMRETLRWHPVLATGIPHATSEEDVYNGYYIPQGVVVIPNSWAMSRDEKKYPNPEAFMPERFFDKDGKLNEDKVTWAFGFGRRICPGRHVADASLWSAMACILTLFRIEQTEGSDNVKWTTGLSSHPHPFPCKLVPRDGKMNAQKLASLIYASRVNS